MSARIYLELLERIVAARGGDPKAASAPYRALIEAEPWAVSTEHAATLPQAARPLTAVAAPKELWSTGPATPPAAGKATTVGSILPPGRPPPIPAPLKR